MGKPARKIKVDDRKLYPEMGERLRVIRKSTGLRSAQFAALIGMKATAWSNYEKGYSIPWQQAKQIRDKMPWITTDYIYFGLLSGPEMARNLGIFASVAEG
jgi:DNA-binding XRE family transcriptional regulator